MKVSVIMGIYNCADTLPEAIDSLLAQTFTDWNLVMCDDGSRDATYEVAERYRRTYPAAGRRRCVHADQIRKGSGHSRRVA